MKKNLLSILALSFVAMSASANEHTLVFDGENDMYGLTRQTTNQVSSMEFVDEFSFTEEGIDFTLKKTDGTGNGYALVNFGGTKAEAGIYVSSGVATEITLTVPNGKITGAKLYMSGYALAALDVSFNGTEISSENEGLIFNWTWNDAEGGETLTLSWPSTFMARYIHSIDLTYTQDLQGKEECGLEFSESTAEAVIGEDFTAPALSNPYDLPLSWSSSDESVATVDADGKITLLKGGKTIITVSTEGNDKYAEGNARYELSVIPTAADIAQMKALAPEVQDRVKVNFPATVTFANGNFAFVLDAEGNAGYFEDLRNHGSTTATETIYKVGDVIPAGWIATNATVYGSMLWQGLPDNVTEQVEVEYPVVTAITPADVDRVVTLEQVTFTTATASENTKAYGTTPDGAVYEFQDTYYVDVYPAGTYDVTGVVRYYEVGSTVYFYMSPIAYSKSVSVNKIGMDSTEGTTRYYNLDGREIANPENGIYLKVNNEKATKVIK